MANTTVNSLSDIKLLAARNTSQNIVFAKNGAASGGLASGGVLYSTFFTSGYPGAGSAYGAAPGAILNNNTTGAIKLLGVGNSSTDVYCYGFKGTINAAAVYRGQAILEDILYGVSGLSLLTAATTTITGTTITRHTTTGGNLYLECTNATTGTLTVNPVITVSYTNQAGTSGRTARFYDIGGQERVSSSCNTVGRRMLATLQQGDTGVKSIESLTVVTASTGWTAGNWALVIASPLLNIRLGLGADLKTLNQDDFLHTGVIKIHSGSADSSATPCLNLCVRGAGSASVAIYGELLCFLHT